MTVYPRNTNLQNLKLKSIELSFKRVRINLPLRHEGILSEREIKLNNPMSRSLLNCTPSHLLGLSLNNTRHPHPSPTHVSLPSLLFYHIKLLQQHFYIFCSVFLFFWVAMISHKFLIVTQIKVIHSRPEKRKQ